MGPIWGRQDPGGLHVGPMTFAIWGSLGQGQEITSAQQYEMLFHTHALNPAVIFLIKDMITRSSDFS